MGRACIDLNCDMGENYGTYQIHTDERLMDVISSVNVACGYHAGDPVEMSRTVELASAHKVSCGAHPGYPDLLGFGRRGMTISAEELLCYLIYQIGALRAMCRVHGIRLSHVKVHGSLYLNAVEERETAKVIGQAIASIDTAIRYYALGGPKGTEMGRMGEYAGLEVVYEGFPGRGYTADGGLVAREKKGAVINDPDTIVERALSMVLDRKVESMDGNCIELEVDTITIPGEIPEAFKVARTIRLELESSGVEILPLGERSLTRGKR